jgi:alpha-D-xyloside xylohydrolase
MNSIPVISEYFRTDDGKQGLQAWYYKDTEYKKLSLEKIDSSININWYATGRPDYVTDSTLAIKWKGKLIPPQTGKYQFHIKCFGPKRIFINDKELPFVYRSVEVYTDLIDLEAGKKYDFALETENFTPGALRVQLYWKTPEILDQEKVIETKVQTRNVYLPVGHQWYDFWTGETLTGGQTVTSAAPIDKIPLLVKAGSILPMGPFLQYASEKPADPLELRVYPGADGIFELYEDENDNYNYEKGKYAIIPLSWNDKQKTLTIGERMGDFAGMLKERTINIVLVNQSTGIGVDLSKTYKTTQYSGKSINVKMD